MAPLASGRASSLGESAQNTPPHPSHIGHELQLNGWKDKSVPCY